MRPVINAKRWNYIVGTLAAAVTLFVSALATAHAQTRVALVIGNGAYRSVPDLSNPPHDATDIAAALRRLGFSVRLVSDATYEDMRRALLGFSQDARNSEMAVVFFAGHGMEIGGENWLVPVDAELKTDLNIEQEAIALRAITVMVSAASKLGLVVLDACRNNPFLSKMKRTIATRAVGRGLSRIEPANNVLVAYAAKDGTTAADGDGYNSPFTTALLKYLEAPGLEINFLFRNVRDDVIAATRSEQQPFVYGSLSKEAIYLKAPVTVPAPPRPDEVAWMLLKETTDEGALKRFAAQYPNSPLGKDAEDRIAALATARGAESKPRAADEIAWNMVKDSTDRDQLRRFLENYPDSPRRPEAEERAIALGNAAANAGFTATTDPHEIARSLQFELKRVGCFNGAVNGEFDAATQAAVRGFTKLTSVKIPDGLSVDAIKAVRGFSGRVCPLVCPDGQRVEGDRCLAAAPPRQEEPRKPAPSKVEPRNKVEPQKEQAKREEPRDRVVTSPPSGGDATRESMKIVGGGAIPTGKSVTITAPSGRKMTCIGGSYAQNIPRRCTWQ